MPNSTSRIDVPAVRKAVAVLEALAQGDRLSMTEIQQRTGVSKTMTFRLLHVLAEQGFVEQDPMSRRYSLGLRLLEFGAIVSHRLPIVSISQPILAELREAFRETVNVAVLTEGQMVYVAIAESRQDLRMANRLGSRGPVYATSIGKAVLAYLPAGQQAAMLASVSLRPLTPHTITDPELFRRELEQTRARGYAIDNEENEIGARCVSVPILSHELPFAGLSVSGPRSRITDDLIPVIAEKLWEASREISRRLGYVPEHGAGDESFAVEPIGAFAERRL
ncbi:MAG TPA: IclR family transcriptional regulator [Thermomicrobiales bacterium]|nr:IclR family transcriptional regulator [Thermomicrobiales bacterium]